jgi:hypothetical protein
MIFTLLVSLSLQVSSETQNHIKSTILNRYYGITPIRPNVSSRRFTDQNASAGARIYSGQICGLRKPRILFIALAAIDGHANAGLASPTGSELITLLFDHLKINGNLNEVFHGCDDAGALHFHRARLCDKSTWTLRLSTLLALDRPILSKPLTTILDLPNTSSEACILRLEHWTILRCIPLTRMTTTHKQPTDDFLACVMVRN